MTKEQRDPFYEWLDHDELRELVNRANELDVGERLVLLKGLVPGLLKDLGAAGFDEALGELQAKGRRYHEAVTHPGEGSRDRTTPGEALGGPIPGGHVHLDEVRDVNRPGGRIAEREREEELWRDRSGSKENTSRRPDTTER